MAATKAAATKARSAMAATKAAAKKARCPVSDVCSPLVVLALQGVSARKELQRLALLIEAFKYRPQHRLHLAFPLRSRREVVQLHVHPHAACRHCSSTTATATACRCSRLRRGAAPSATAPATPTTTSDRWIGSGRRRRQPLSAIAYIRVSCTVHQVLILLQIGELVDLLLL